jgi:hypothetical protein
MALMGGGTMAFDVGFGHHGERHEDGNHAAAHPVLDEIDAEDLAVTTARPWPIVII